MSYKDYCALDTSLKKALLLKQGVLLSRRLTADYKATLFALDDFYVEVVYYPDMTPCFTSFKDMDLLEPYLETIDISELIA